MKVKLYTEPKKYMWVEVETEEKAMEIQKLNRALWRQAKLENKEIAMSRLQRNAEKGEDRMEDKIEDENSNILEQIIEQEDCIERRQMIKILRKAVVTLKPDQQEIIRMAFTESMNHAEIGQALGVSKQAIQQRMETIIKKLKTFF